MQRQLAELPETLQEVSVKDDAQVLARLQEPEIAQVRGQLLLVEAVLLGAAHLQRQVLPRGEQRLPEMLGHGLRERSAGQGALGELDGLPAALVLHGLQLVLGVPGDHGHALEQIVLEGAEHGQLGRLHHAVAGQLVAQGGAVGVAVLGEEEVPAVKVSLVELACVNKILPTRISAWSVITTPIPWKVPWEHHTWVTAFLKCSNWREPLEYIIPDW